MLTFIAFPLAAILHAAADKTFESARRERFNVSGMLSSLRSVCRWPCAALAFLHYARHATDREHIVLADDCLLVERSGAEAVRQVGLDACRASVTAPRRRIGEYRGARNPGRGRAFRQRG
ncbi:MAG TPA: hypothetical protein VEC06_13220 [Paucimonas sp.]|nr:hypothetical protein [Paucimonas sp.]